MASSKSAGRNTPTARKSAPAAKSATAAAKKAAVKKAIVKKAIVKKAVKKAIVKKAVKKAIAKNSVKKAIVKKAVAKKATAASPAKKALVKKAIVKKVVAKKVVAAVKKQAVKKAVVRNVVAKKAAQNAVKKAIVRRAVAKKAVKKALVKKAIKAAAVKRIATAKKATSVLDERGQLEQLLLGQLSEACFFQRRIQKAIAKLIKNSSNSGLKELLQQHLSESGGVLKRLSEVFALLNLKEKSSKSPALEGILGESDAFMAQFPKGPGRDAALIAGAQKLRHNEAAVFSVLRRLARLLGHDKLADIFETLRQGSRTLDKQLAAVADEAVANFGGNGSPAAGNSNTGDVSNEDSQAGEDSSSHVSGNEESAGSDAENVYWTGEEAAFDKVSDGGDREGPSTTGEPMGY